MKPVECFREVGQALQPRGGEETLAGEAGRRVQFLGRLRIFRHGRYRAKSCDMRYSRFDISNRLAGLVGAMQSVLDTHAFRTSRRYNQSRPLIQTMPALDTQLNELRISRC
jgi:hypothetical protein